MRLKCAFLIVLAFAFSCKEVKTDLTEAVNIITKLTQDLQSSPSGYIYHHHSDSVRPGGYNADIDHGKAKIAGQLGMEKLAGLNGHGKSGIYRVAGGYGFMISHDYGTQSIRSGASQDDMHSGASNADHASIGVLQLGTVRTTSGSPRSIDIGEKSDSVEAGKSDGPDSYMGKEIYESYMEYDKLVKDGKNGPSVYPREYYESDGRDWKEKYRLDDEYGESNNAPAADKGEYLESEKYDGSEDYNENERYGAVGGNGDSLDDGETDKYVTSEEYGKPDDFIAKKSSGLHEGYAGEEYNDDRYEPYEINDQLTDRNKNYEDSATHAAYDHHNDEPTFEDVKNSILDDFFKEYNEFSKGANIQVGFKNDHEHDDDYHHEHALEDEGSHYAENGESEKNFYDDADLHGDYHEEADGETNSNFGEKKGHKKGSKTTGFRNVLHKDEYTKDHTFYEHANKKGHFNKDGDYGEHEYQNEGSHEKSRHHDSSLDENHRGKSDSEDKGHSVHDDLYDHDEHGYKSYFDDNSEYHDGGDSEHGSEYGHGYGV